MGVAPGCGLKALFFAFLEYEGVVVSLNLENTAVSLTFLGCDWKLTVPGFEQLSVLAGKPYAVGFFHVKTDSGDDSAGLFTGLRFFQFEIHNCFAFAVHGFRIVGPLAVHKVVAVAVDFANGGVKVVQVTFHDFERFVVGAAVLAAPFFPTGKEVAHVMGGDNMLPFDGLGSL